MISTFIATGKLNEFFLYQSNTKKTRMDHSILLPFNTGGQVLWGRWKQGLCPFVFFLFFLPIFHGCWLLGQLLLFQVLYRTSGVYVVVGDKNILRSINCSFIFYTLYRETTLLCPLPLHPIVIIGSVAPFSFPISFV